MVSEDSPKTLVPTVTPEENAAMLKLAAPGVLGRKLRMCD